jgi:Zn-dependent protease/CBS domain-containing protein
LPEIFDPAGFGRAPRERPGRAGVVLSRPQHGGDVVFGRRIPLMRVLGFEIRFDLTWLIVVALIVWSLSAGLFPSTYANLPTSTYVWMGILGAIGLFASIVLHELAHSVVGRRLGMRIHGITLFAFGGASELAEEPPTARTEFLMAIAGPVMSVVLAVLFYLLGWLIAASGGPGPLVGVLGYLVGMNLILAAFNMVPAFPLDGGRVLRAALWAWRGDVAWATRMATMIGGGIGLVLIFLGIIEALTGAAFDGIWLVLIGMFIRAAAAATYQRLVAGQLLAGVPVRRLMKPGVLAVPPILSVAELVEDYLLQRALKRVPVLDETGRVLGCVGIEEVKRVSPQQRAFRSVREILTPLSPDGTISPDADAKQALEQMQRGGQSRLFVTEGDHLVGVLTLRDLLQYLSVKSELQPSGDRRPGTPGSHRPFDAAAE